jgi:fructokinase
MSLFGGIECGGSSFVCAIGAGPGDIVAETAFPTTTPAETLARAVEFFRSEKAQHAISAVGIASFGPVDLDRSSPTYGYITTTPKPGWGDVDVAGHIGRELSLPVGFDTDVNATALAEHRWGNAVGLDSFVYITVGTGIGGGALLDGRPVHGLVHPEMGHMRVPHDPEDGFEGCCPYHGDCLEGLASGPAIRQRWGAPPEELPDDHPAWELEAKYLAAGLVNLVLALSPRRIVLGGGVMARSVLYPLVRQGLLDRLAGYVQAPALIDDIAGYVVPPALGDRAGVLGAIALAEAAVA